MSGRRNRGRSRLKIRLSEAWSMGRIDWISRLFECDLVVGRMCKWLWVIDVCD
jgi:hypothetical protein